MRFYQVIVGNIGTVYIGHTARDARQTFAEYVDQSRQNYGRASGEDVVMLRDGEVISDFIWNKP